MATARNAHGGPHGRLDFESETFIAHTLRGEGFDASEDGTGRGTPLVPIAFNGRMDPMPGEVTGALDTDASTQCIAFSSKDHGADATDDIAPTLHAGGHDKSHANAGVPPAIVYPITADALRGDGTAKTPSADAAGNVRLRDPGLGIGDDGDPASTLHAAGPGAIAFALRGREGGAMPEAHEDVSALRASSGGSTRDYVAQPFMAVRRLTPTEAERLQGFPEGFTAITYRGKPAADGNRYRALGNSWAVPCAAWVARRIEVVRSRVAGW